MGLSNLTFPTVMVETSGGTLAVRGLSFDHIFGLFNRHTVLVGTLFDMVVNEYKTGKFDADRAVFIMVKMIESAPSVVAEIIAISSGSDPADGDAFVGDVGIARMLSLAEQLDALEKIAGQTFTSAMPPGKVLALVLKTMGLSSSAVIQAR